MNGYSLLAVQWTELHEYVPEWVMRSALQPAEISSNYTLLLGKKQIIVSAAHIGKIVDCEEYASSGVTNHMSLQEIEESLDEGREVRISNTIDAYREDMSHICTEIDSKEQGGKDSWAFLQSKTRTTNRFLGFARRLKECRRKEREDNRQGVFSHKLLDSPVQRLGRLEYRNKKIWSLAAACKNRSSIRTESEAEPDSWNKVETLLDQNAVFGMKFGIVERKIPINQMLFYIGDVYSGVGLLYKEAQPDDMLFQLPGLRHPVVLRQVGRNFYRLIGDCIFRVNKQSKWKSESNDGFVKEIYIEL